MTTATPTAPDAASSSANVSLLRRLARNRLGLAASLFLVFVALIAVFGPMLAPYDPSGASLEDAFGPISWEHPLGLTGAGIDVLSRLLVATRFSVIGALIGLVVASTIGLTTGLIAGYYGGWFDQVSAWAASLLMALPGIIVLLAVRAIVGPSMFLSMVVFGVLLTPPFHRLVYASVSAVRNELYVDAARVAGLSDPRIIGRHVLSVVRGPAIIQGATITGLAIAMQAGLEFLGLGQLGLPTWGSMLNDAFKTMYQAPQLLIWPGLAIALTCVATVLLANSLRDEMEGVRRTPSRRKGARSLPAPELNGKPVLTHDQGPGAQAPLLDVAALSVGYERPDGGIKVVVQEVSLRVSRGEVLGLVGESGSGKTQTAWSVLGLLPEGGQILSGAITFDGKDLVGLSDSERSSLRGKRIAYVPQEPMSNLDPSFTIGSQLVEPMVVCLGIGRREAKRRALELLGRVGIPDPERTFAAYPHQISGGMAQRVLIAGAVSCGPDLLIADEPTTALDVTVQAEVLDLLRGLQEEFGMGVILVTHNFGVVADLCDRLAVMREGRVVEEGPVRAVLASPKHPYTQALLASTLDGGPARGPWRAERAASTPDLAGRGVKS